MILLGFLLWVNRSTASLSGPLVLASEGQLGHAGVPHAHQRVLERPAGKDRRSVREQRGQVCLLQR